ncbi:hypothetical protein [Pseudomonas sp. GM78]|nr:hypothetical protein [Pseudomonas sp. GM78]
MASVVQARGAGFDTCCWQLAAISHFMALNLTFRDAYADAQHAWPK